LALTIIEKEGGWALNRKKMEARQTKNGNLFFLMPMNLFSFVLEFGKTSAPKASIEIHFPI
jgi:hypothetical protein